MSTEPDHTLLQAPLTRSVIATFYHVHRSLGFGFREYIYALALERDLRAKGHQVDRELGAMVYYLGKPLAMQKLDMVVDATLVVETKATEHLHSDATLQLFSYLNATNLEVGLVLHFGREPRFYRVICENRLKLHRP
ncbi:MAG: GxxExxY protein [Gemmatimonadota bacterium]